MRFIVPLLLLLAVMPARAQQPAITLVVNYVAGGATDIIARIMQPVLAEEWGAPVLIKNTAGASGAMGAAEAARARPDGLTLLLSPSGGSVIAPNFQRPAPPYSIRSFAPICQVVETPMVTMAPPSTGLRNMAQFLDRARAANGGYAYSTAGVGSGPHLALIAFSRLTGVALNHIPFRGSGEAVLAMQAGTVETLSDQASLVRQYGLVALSVWSAQRASQFPDVPTMKEQGFNLEFDIWSAIYAPLGTPEPLLARYEAGCQRMLRHPSVVAGLARVDMNIRWRNRVELGRYMLEEDAKFRDLIESANLRAGE